MANSLKTDSEVSNPQPLKPANPLRLLAFGLKKISLRHWMRNWFRTLILVLIIGVGVGAYFSIRLANKAAVMGFTWFSDSISGESPLVVLPHAGKADTSLLRQLRTKTGILPVHFYPVLETTGIDAASIEPGGDMFSARQFTITGMDLLSLANLVYTRPPGRYQPPKTNFDDDDGDGEENVLLNPDGKPEVFVTAKLASKRSLDINSIIRVILNDDALELLVAGIIPENEFIPSPPESLLLMDLNELQELLGEPDRVDRVEIQIPESGNRQHFLSLLTEVQEQLDPGTDGNWSLVTQKDRKDTAMQMTEGFQLNLSILSLLALIVGVYLIFQSLEASIARRRSEAAALKSLGWKQLDVQLLWIVESFIIGVAGSAIGLAIGFLTAQVSVQAISQTVNSLYYSNSVEAAGFDSREAWIAFILGVAASLAAGWFPARQISSTPPAHALGREISTDSGINPLRYTLPGICLFSLGILFSQMGPIESGYGRPIPLGGYLAAFLWLISSGMILVSLFPLIARITSKIGRDSLSWHLALSYLRRPSLHHFWALAGLIASTGMAAAMAILIASFESTILQWMNTVLKADVYIASAGISNASTDNRIQSTTWQRIATLDQVQSVDLGRMEKIVIDGKMTWLTGAPDSLFDPKTSAIWIKKPAPDFVLDFQKSSPSENSLVPGVITETFGHHFDVGPGDIVPVPTPNGEIKVKIGGVFADYGSELGSIVIPHPDIVDRFNSDHILNMALHLKNPEDAPTVASTIKTMFPNIVVRENNQIREEALKIFRQTFSVTYALQLIGFGVAITGLALALTSLWMGRISQIRTWKELGITNRQASAIAVKEGLAISIAGTAGGILLSLAMGWLLVYVINRQSFGWTLDMTIPMTHFLILGSLLISAGVLVSWLIARNSFINSSASNRER